MINKNIYSGTGIYTEEDRVIHFTRTKGGESSNQNGGRCCGCCGYDASQHRGGLVKTCLDCFLKDSKLYRFEYNVTEEHFVLKKSGTCSTGPCDNPDIVIRRATEMLGSPDAFGDYHLLQNNCEAFARYCKTGQRVSLQVVSKESQAEIDVKAIISKPFSVAEAIGQIMVGHRLEMLAFDQNVHAENLKIKGKDEDKDGDGDGDEDEDEDEDKKHH